jgi:enoyl-CoA hydratase
VTSRWRNCGFFAQSIEEQGLVPTIPRTGIAPQRRCAIVRGSRSYRADEPIMIDLTVEDDIAVVTLKHGKANALDTELCTALVTCFDELVGQKARAVVLTGQGRMFSAGVDLVRATAGGADYLRTFLPALHRLFEAVFFHPKPVVAAINGHAIAGGCVLACCGDRRIMARGAGRIGVTELLVGVPFPALAFEIVRFAVLPHRLSELVLGGATYETDAALQCGWIDEAVDADALMAAARDAAQMLARLSPAAFAQTKKQIRELVAARVAQSGVATDKIVTDIWTAPEALGQMRAYVERTLKKG